MSDAKFQAKRAALNRDLEQLEDELAATPLEHREAIVEQIEEIEWALRDLALDQRNKSSMDGGSEA
jgi:hypothetical protein